MGRLWHSGIAKEVHANNAVFTMWHKADLVTFVVVGITLLLSGIVIGVSVERSSLAAESQRQLAEAAEPVDVLSQLLGLTSPMLQELKRTLKSELLSPAPLVKRHASKSVLVDAFVRFHNLLWEEGYFPLSNHGLGRDSTNLYESMPAQSYRAFYRRQSWRIPQHAQCIGFATNTQEMGFMPRCARDRFWSIEYRQSERPRAVHSTRTLRLDLTTLTAANAPMGIASSFDVVQCHEVFEHVKDPFAAARGIFVLLKPGGLIFFHVPFVLHIHGKLKRTKMGDQFFDFFRYTAAAAEHIFTTAGFEVLSSEMTGNDMLSVGTLLGFGKDDFTAAQLSRGFDLVNASCRLRRCRETTSSGQSAVTMAHRIPSSAALVLRKPWKL